MINWNYNADEAQDEYELIPEGKHRVRIAEVKEGQSKSGNDMFTIVLDVSGHSSKVWYYLAFLPDNTKMTNINLKRIWDSFNIPAGNLNPTEWVGKVGAAKIKHEEYMGDVNAKVDRFVDGDGLPAWQEKMGMAQAKSALKSQGFIDVEVDDDVPF